MPFSPSLEASQAATGATVVNRPHPGGSAGAEASLKEVAKMAYKGRQDLRLQQWVWKKALAPAGKPSTTEGQMQAILDAYRKQTMYVQDPVNTEQMKMPAVSLCLDDKGLCLPANDCDDGVIAVAAAGMSIGIPVQIVGQSFASDGVPTHVILAYEDQQTGKWVRVDPSSKYDVGGYYPATKEVWINPMTMVMRGEIGHASGEFVSIGRIPAIDKICGVGFIEHTYGSGDSIVEYLAPDMWNAGYYVGAPVGVGSICNQDALVQYKIRLNAPWWALNDDLVNCPNVTLDQKTAFTFDFQSFKTWYNQPLPLCDADIEIRGGQDFEARYNSWRLFLVNLGCPVSAPALSPLPDTDPRSPNYKPPPGFWDTVKTGIITTAVIGGIGALGYGVLLAMGVIGEAGIAGWFASKTAAHENPDLTPSQERILRVYAGIDQYRGQHKLTDLASLTADGYLRRVRVRDEKYPKWGMFDDWEITQLGLAHVQSAANPLTPKQKTAFWIGGGAIAAAAGIYAMTRKAQAATTPPQLPGPTQQPPESYMPVWTYKGVTIHMGPDQRDAYQGYWIAVYNINGQDFAIHARTNVSGMVSKVQNAIDSYYASIQWVPVPAVGQFIPLQAGNVYDVSVPAAVANTVLLPYTLGVNIPFSSLPPDWPATDRADPTETRAQFKIPGGSTPINIPAANGVQVWVLIQAPQAPSPGP